MDESTIQSLLGNTSGSSDLSLFDVNTLLQQLMPYIIVLTIVAIAIAILYLVSIIQKWRANAAIIEIRDILRDMHSQKQAYPPVTPTSSDASVNAT